MVKVALDDFYMITLAAASLTGIVVLFHKAYWYWKLLAITVILYFGVECYGSYLAWQGIHNLWLYNPAFLCLFLVEATVLVSVLQWTAAKWLVVAYLLIFGIYSLLTYPVLLSPDYIDSLSFAIGGSVSFLLACCCLIQLYLSDSNTPITHEPTFWYCFGLIMRYSVEVMLFSALNYAYIHYKTSLDFYYTYIEYPVNIFDNICILMAFICVILPRKSSSL